LNCVELPGRFDPRAMPGIYAQASALLVSLVRSPIMSRTVPSKVQAYLAAGRPIVASMDGEGARVVEEAEAGVTCPAEDATALATAVLRLRSMDVAERDRLGANARRYFDRHFDPDRLAERLEGLLTGLTASVSSSTDNQRRNDTP
jgi:glycosyltransferase involved in cell wall biosynthesis